MSRILPCSLLLLVGCFTEPEHVDETDVTLTYDHQLGDFQGCNNVRLSVESWEYVDGTPEAVVVLTTGRQEYTGQYAGLVPYLDERPWNVVMWDQSGQGRSGGKVAHADDFDTQHVCDLEKIVAEHPLVQGLPVLFVAHSTGGMIGARYQQRNPGTITAAAYSSPLWQFVAPGYTEAQARGLAADMVLGMLGEQPATPPEPPAPCELNDLTHDCLFYDTYKDDELRIIGPPTFGWINAVFQSTDRIDADLAGLTEPTLVIQAGLDTVVGKDEMVTHCAAMADCTVEVREENYHANFLEVDRGRIMELSAEFFDDAL